jgi:type I restriction enzyme S subunit
MFNRTGEGLPLIRIRDVGATDTETYYSGEFDDGFLVAAGDLLVGMDGDFRAARWAGRQALLNQRVCRITNRDHSLYDDRFLALVLQPYLDEVNKRTSSVTVKHLSSKTVAELPVPLPPRAEQTRIANELERRLSHVDAAVAGLQSALKRIVTARRSVLESTANGSLLGFDSNQWPSVTAGSVTEVRGGIQKQPKRKPVKNSAPFLRVANVGRGVLNLSEVHEIELFDGELASYELRRGDLLVVEGNGSIDHIGRAATWNGSIPGCVHQNHLIRVRPGPKIDPAFLAFVWNAPSTVKQLVAVASSTSGLYTLSTGKIKSVKIPLPEVAQQELLSAEAERRLSIIGVAERAITTILAGSHQLRRSLLATAFSGQLVPQNPSDERAEQLLRRIVEQRAAQAKEDITDKSASRRPTRTKKKDHSE